jgi:hypothetical protein
VGEEERKLVQEQLAGFAKSVASDENFEANKADHLVTFESLKKRLEEAKLTGDPPAATNLDRRANRKMNNMTPKQMDAAKKALGGRLPITDRRAAIEHTRKLNELGNDS